MGFMGLSHWAESDRAADMQYVLNKVIKKSIDKIINKEMRDEANPYNTPGPINIALLLEDGVINIDYLSKTQYEFVLGQLQGYLFSWDKEHHKAIKRMIKYVKKVGDKKDWD